MAHVPRIFWPQAPAIGHPLELDTDRSHHLLRVLRRRPGDAVCLVVEPDREFGARIVAGNSQLATLEVVSEQQVQRESALRLRLVQGISRGDKMEFTIQKAVELGAIGILPVLTARGGVQLDAARLAKKQQHWQAVALAAAEQCGRTRLPQIETPCALSQYLADGPHQGWVLGPQLSSAALPVATLSQRLDVVIGPEAGLDESEIAAATRQGLTPLRLGPRVLRTETAGIVALSALQTRWGDLHWSDSAAPCRAPAQ